MMWDWARGQLKFTNEPEAEAQTLRAAVDEKLGDKTKQSKRGGKRPGSGRKKGTPNKFTMHLKEAILEAARLAGGDGGEVAYLQRQANENPGPFMSLLGKVLPLQVAGDKDNPLFAVIEQRIVDPKR